MLTELDSGRMGVGVVVFGLRVSQVSRYFDLKSSASHGWVGLRAPREGLVALPECLGCLKMVASGE